MKKLTGILAAIVTVFVSCFMLAGCSGPGDLDPEMTVTIDGVDFTLDCKVSDILDAGFRVVTYSSGSMSDDLPSVEGREMVSGFYSIVRPDGTNSHVSVNIYNKSYNEVEASECYVYEFKYDVGSFSNDPDHPIVTFNGIDMYYTDNAEVVAALEELGFKFKEEDKKEFFVENDPYASRLLSAKGLLGHHFSISTDYDYDTGKKPVDGFDLTLDLDYEIVEK